MEYDELELDTLGEEKTALFVIISDTDATFNFVVSIMYSQLFNLLCDKAAYVRRRYHYRGTDGDSTAFNTVLIIHGVNY